MPSNELPNIAEILAPLIERVPAEQRPLLIALAERLAAERYRSWADAANSAEDRAALLACADREEEIAGRVEGLHSGASAIQTDLLERHPGLADLNRTLFAGRPIEDQYAMQASGERVGAATWRSFARHAEPVARKIFLDCAELEESSAKVLESILARS